MFTLLVSQRVAASCVSLDMVEVASSNLAGPTKFLSICFYSYLFFVFAKSSSVVASYLYPTKVVLKNIALPPWIKNRALHCVKQNALKRGKPVTGAIRYCDQ